MRAGRVRDDARTMSVAPFSAVRGVLEYLPVLAVPTLLLTHLLASRARRIAAAMVLVVAVPTALGLLLAGPRRTTAVALAMTIVLGASSLRAPGRAPAGARWIRRTAAVVAVIATIGLAGVTWALPVPVFPSPTGPFQVGTQTRQLSFPDRREQDGGPRSVVVQLWYPAGPGAVGTPAHYLGRDQDEASTVANALAGYAGVPGLLLDGPSAARPGPLQDSAPAAGRFPLVVFSPGLGGVRATNTAWAQEVASRGYVVAALDHPGDSAVVVLDDGREIPTRVAATGDDARDRELAVEAVRVRVRDLSDTLTALTTSDALADHVDGRRVAAAGHSLGGGAALAVAATDPRFRAAVDLDGFPYLAGRPPLRRPALVLTHPLDPGESPGLAAEIALALAEAPGSVHRTVPGTEHLSFTDAPLWLPPLPGIVGTLGRDRPVALTARLSADFLDRELRTR